MIIEYVEGEMIITHPTGIVDNYDVPELQKIKASDLVMLARSQSNVDCINEYITNAEASIGEPPPTK